MSSAPKEIKSTPDPLSIVPSEILSFTPSKALLQSMLTINKQIQMYSLLSLCSYTDKESIELQMKVFDMNFMQNLTPDFIEQITEALKQTLLSPFSTSSHKLKAYFFIASLRKVPVKAVLDKVSAAEPVFIKAMQDRVASLSFYSPRDYDFTKQALATLRNCGQSILMFTQIGQESLIMLVTGILNSLDDEYYEEALKTLSSLNKVILNLRPEVQAEIIKVVLNLCKPSVYRLNHLARETLNSLSTPTQNVPHAKQGKILQPDSETKMDEMQIEVIQSLSAVVTAKEPNDGKEEFSTLEHLSATILMQDLARQEEIIANIITVLLLKEKIGKFRTSLSSSEAYALGIKTLNALSKVIPNLKITTQTSLIEAIIPILTYDIAFGRNFKEALETLSNLNDILINVAAATQIKLIETLIAILNKDRFPWLRAQTLVALNALIRIIPNLSSEKQLHLISLLYDGKLINPLMLLAMTNPEMYNQVKLLLAERSDIDFIQISIFLDVYAACQTQENSAKSSLYKLDKKVVAAADGGNPRAKFTLSDNPATLIASFGSKTKVTSKEDTDSKHHPCMC